MDLTSPAVIKELRSRFDFYFKKGLGQNFLTSRTVLEEIADAADCSNGVLEIGPGFGVLTQELALRAPKVVSLEIDSRLIPVLDYTLAEFDHIKIIQADAMKADLDQLIRDEFPDRKISVAANLPYYITTPILTRLLESKLPIRHIVVMIQKEVAERICAAPGTKEYGAISVLCQYYTKPELICRVPASLFIPPPKVDSAVLKMTVLDSPSVSAADETLFFRIVRAAFAQRRKTLLNCLCAGFGQLGKNTLEATLSQCGIDPRRRGETLSLSEFASLTDAVQQLL